MKDFDLIPRIEFSHSPTPIEFAPRLSEYLGSSIFIKRDDCTGLAAGGNKTRKLEYLLADALHNDADVLITIGGLQSNHARQTAAVATKYGLGCELVLEDVPGTPKSDYYNNGNMLLNNLLGAKVHRMDADADVEEYVESLIQRLKNDGKNPYLIPVGGSNVIGSYGYVRCAIEIVQQLTEQRIKIDQIILATGSAGTQAGLLAGLISVNMHIPVLGITVSRDRLVQEEMVESLLRQTLTELELNPDLAKDQVVANSDYLGEGYAIPTKAMIEAVKLSAKLEALLLDPVYTGKAMSGLIDLCTQGDIAAGSNLLFLHTGGNPGLFSYREIF